MQIKAPKAMQLDTVITIENVEYKVVSNTRVSQYLIELEKV